MMQNSDKLTELVEQASLAINTLSPSDISEIENLQKILDQINQSFAGAIDGPAELLEQAKGATSDSVEILHKILQKDIVDSAKSFETVSHAIVVLQGLIGQVNQAHAEVDSEHDKKNYKDTIEPAPQDNVIIPGENVPLILDFITESSEHI